MNPIGWVEIPVKDMSRAIKFYNHVLGFELQEISFGDLKMAWFPFDHEKNGCTGSLVQQESYSPSSSQGPLVYFSCDDVNLVLDRLKQFHGEVLLEKRKISDDFGFMGMGIDSEGNRIAFHSAK